MMIASRLLSVFLVVALVGPGVVSPLRVRAQSQMPPADEPSPPVQAQPAPGQPDLYEEPLTARRSAVGQGQGAYVFGSVMLSTVAVPGRLLLCVGSIPLSFVTLVLTLGSGYGAAKSIFEEGCAGKWVVTPDDIRAANGRSSRGAYSP